MKRLKLVLLMSLVSFTHICCSQKDRNEEFFKKNINDSLKNSFKEIITKKYKSQLIDSIAKSGNNFYSIKGYQNELHIMNVLENKTKDSLFVIAINESKVDKSLFSNEINYEKTPCSFYALVGIPLIKTKIDFYFNTGNINVFSTKNACINSYSLKTMKKEYHRYLLDALNKTKDIKLDKNNGILLLRKITMNNN